MAELPVVPRKREWSDETYAAVLRMAEMAAKQFREASKEGWEMATDEKKAAKFDVPDGYVLVPAEHYVALAASAAAWERYQRSRPPEGVPIGMSTAS